MGAFQMHFIAISINHRTADVALREQVAFRDDAYELPMKIYMKLNLF